MNRKNRNKRRKIIYEKFNGHCAYCGKVITIEEMQIDHFIPFSRFGNIVKAGKNVPSFLSHLNKCDRNHIDNLFPACQTCNNSKRNLLIENFRKELKNMPKRLERNSHDYRLCLKFGVIKQTYSKINFYYEKFLVDKRKH